MTHSSVLTVMLSLVPVIRKVQKKKDSTLIGYITIMVAAKQQLRENHKKKKN